MRNRECTYVASEFEPPRAKNELDWRAIDRNAKGKGEVVSESRFIVKCCTQKSVKRGIFVARVSDMRMREMIASRMSARKTK